MIKNKKLLGILLAASMMSGLTACQSSDAKKPEDTGNVRQSGTDTETDTTAQGDKKETENDGNSSGYSVTEENAVPEITMARQPRKKMRI